MQKYFSHSDNFLSIINKASKKTIIDIQYNPVGWTNIVQKFKTEQGIFIAKFPRDAFWAKVIIHESNISNFIENKTSFKTPKMTLNQDIEGRYFSIHKEIEGESLDTKINSLSVNDLEAIAEDIAKFLSQLHKINIQEFDKKIDNIEFFLKVMLSYHNITQDFSSLDSTLKKYLIHGDFNSKNIIIDNKNKFVGVIDFGFAALGDVEYDLARILNQIPIPYFQQNFIKSYKKYSNIDIDDKKLKQTQKIWEEIDDKYIEYMKTIKFL